MNDVVERKPQTLQGVLQSYESDFKATLVDDRIKFAAEIQFAEQALRANPYLISVARENPSSLRDAIINIAAVGLSLNPVSKLAYLVPRRINKKPAICLDISYMGLIRAATDSMSIKWAQAEIVRENDVFKRVGVDKPPVHEINEFGDRGKIVGAYCVVKTMDNDYLTEVMTRDELFLIRSKSESFKKGYGPWVDFQEEMMKKTVAKRAAKMWPRTNRIYHLEKAIDVVNEHEGIDFNEEYSDLPKLEKHQTEAGFLYQFQNGIFRGKTIADIYEDDEIDRLEDYIAKTEARKDKKNWMPEMIRVVRQTLENFESYRDAYLETIEGENV